MNKIKKLKKIKINYNPIKLNYLISKIKSQNFSQKN